MAAVTRDGRPPQPYPLVVTPRWIAAPTLLLAALALPACAAPPSAVAPTPQARAATSAPTPQPATTCAPIDERALTPRPASGKTVSLGALYPRDEARPAGIKPLVIDFGRFNLVVEGGSRLGGTHRSEPPTIHLGPEVERGWFEGGVRAERTRPFEAWMTALDKERSARRLSALLERRVRLGRAEAGGVDRDALLCTLEAQQRNEADLQQRKGDAEATRAALDAALSKASSLSPNEQLLAAIFALRGAASPAHERGRALLDTILGDPKNPTALRARAAMFAASWASGDARTRHCETARQLAPTTGFDLGPCKVDHYARGQELEAAGKPDEALAAYSQCLLNQDLDEDALPYLGPCGYSLAGILSAQSGVSGAATQLQIPVEYAGVLTHWIALHAHQVRDRDTLRRAATLALDVDPMSTAAPLLDTLLAGLAPAAEKEGLRARHDATYGAGSQWRAGVRRRLALTEETRAAVDFALTELLKPPADRRLLEIGPAPTTEAEWKLEIGTTRMRDLLAPCADVWIETGVDRPTITIDTTGPIPRATISLGKRPTGPNAALATDCIVTRAPSLFRSLPPGKFTVHVVGRRG